MAESAACVTEAAFGLQREAATLAITIAVTSSPCKHAHIAPDMNWIQQVDDPEATTAPTCVKDVAKGVKQQAGKTTASVVAKWERQVV